MWTTLPQLPVRYFGLGKVSGKLVAVGGTIRVMINWTIKKEVMLYTCMMNNHKGGSRRFHTCQQLDIPQEFWTSSQHCSGRWIHIRRFCKYGWDLQTRHTTVVQDRSTTNRLFWDPSHLNQAFNASVDDLLRNAVPANETTHSGSSDTQSAWKTLPNTPTYWPAASVLAGNLAVGGTKTSEGESDKKEVYMYSPSIDSWIYISDLPAPRSDISVIALSSTEIMVIGGKGITNDGRVKVNTVYKGILHL